MGVCRERRPCRSVQGCPGVCRYGVFRDVQGFAGVCMVLRNIEGHVGVGAYIGVWGYKGVGGYKGVWR